MQVLCHRNGLRWYLVVVLHVCVCLYVGMSVAKSLTLAITFESTSYLSYSTNETLSNYYMVNDFVVLTVTFILKIANLDFDAVRGINSCFTNISCFLFCFFFFLICSLFANSFFGWEGFTVCN